MTTYSAVGSTFETAQASVSGAGPYSITVSGAVVGNIWVLGYLTEADVAVSSISGGGVTTWTRVQDNAWANGQLSAKVELWWGIITSGGSTSISVTTASSLNTHILDACAQQFSSTDGSGWAFNTGGQVSTGTRSTSISFPSLTPTHAVELYFGFVATENQFSAGATSSYTYRATGLGDGDCYSLSISAVTTPTASMSPTGYNKSVAGLFFTTGSGSAAPSAGLAAVTAAAFNPTVAVTKAAPVVSTTVAAFNPTVFAGNFAFAGLATASTSVSSVQFTGKSAVAATAYSPFVFFGTPPLRNLRVDSENRTKIIPKDVRTAQIESG